MNSLEQVLRKLDLTEYNGLFYFSKKQDWKDKFPYWIKRALDIIQPDAFYCYRNDIASTSPFILFFDKLSPDKEKAIHKQVWNFNQAPAIILIKDAEIEIYNGFIFDEKLSKLDKISNKDIGWEEFTFLNMQSGKVWNLYKKYFRIEKRVDQYLLSNISSAITKLTKLGIKKSIANNLIGRLIFSRYLIDRNVNIDEKFISGDTIEDKKQSFSELLLDKSKLYEYFKYLKEKFNGNLFPLDNNEIIDIDEKHLFILNQLFSGTEIETGQLVLFDLYDFSIIPIELISNIYERFIGVKQQKKDKSFYTPIFLVDYVLSQTVGTFLKNNNKATCKVLDPSCGSGIFLVETLRKIIEKYQKLNNSLPDDDIKRLISENIFGIDRDEDAVNVAIFSIYITLLDYKSPKDIANFRFPILKDTNFFVADFFDLNHTYNKKMKEVDFHFILGNPPWGSIKKGLHISYCKQENIPISDCQISQCFIARTKDFSNKMTQCSLIVTSKILYNLNAKLFREYLLDNFFINRVLELSSVRRQVFNSAIGSAAIMFYNYAYNNCTLNNVIHHISIKPNLFFKLFKVIAIEKFDYKQILQKYFKEFDWLWKTILYGNVLDFYFIKGLMENRKVKDLIDNKKINAGVGYTVWENHNTKYYPEFREKMYKLVTPNLLKPFYLDISNAPINNITNFYRIGDESVYNKPHLLIQKAIKDMPIISFVEDDCIFEKKIFAISSDKSSTNLIKCIGALYSSDLSKYLLFMLCSQWGIHIDEIYLEEYLNIPIPENFEKGDLDKIYDTIISFVKQECCQDNVINFFDNDLSVKKYIKKINNEVDKLFNLSDLEKDLISYTLDVSIPLFKDKDTPYKPTKDKCLEEYANVFIDHFVKRFINYNEFFRVEIYKNNYFVAMNFIISAEKPNNLVEFIDSTEISSTLELMGGLSVENISNNLFIQKDIKGFEENSFFVIKPNEYKNWHRAVARLDLNEFMDAIMKAGKEKLVGSDNA